LLPFFRNRVMPSSRPDYPTYLDQLGLEASAEESRGAIGVYGSKDATREAFAKGLISNGDEWMAMIQARNRSSHTYNEKTANEIATAVRTSFVREFELLQTKLAELEAAEA
jgi:nucleotidyltransferase substrate binding protein (TIGR01987 family)